MRRHSSSDEYAREVLPDSSVDQTTLPGLELIVPSRSEAPTYLCVACWRRISVGVHAHACFFSE